MKTNYKTSYSITAYSINLKERSKYYNGLKKDLAIDKTDYISNTSLFVGEFLDYLKTTNKNTDHDYLVVLKTTKITNQKAYGVELFINYGRNGLDFTTVEKNGKKQEFDKNTKLAKYYKIFFLFRDDGSAFMVVFRNGVNSCKTVIMNEMNTFLARTNIMVDLPYVSNNQYLNEIAGDWTPVKLNFTTLHKAYSNDNADNPKIIKKRYSTTSIDLTLDSSRTRFFDIILDCFKGIQNKNIISTMLTSEIGESKEYEVDEDTMSVVVSLGGVNRTVPLKEMLSFYDVDVSSRLRFDSKDNPTDESIVEVVTDYVSGIGKM